jgi:TolB protein
MAAPHPEGTLVYSVREWAGEFFSRDVPGGVETTSVRSGLWRIKADGTGRRRVPVPGDRAEHPLASRDGRWIYFQAEADGRWCVCRVRPDGSDLMTVAPADGRGDGRTSRFGTALAADGQHLTYTAYDGTAGWVVRARADGSAAQVLAPEFGHAYMAVPDAKAERVVCSGPARGYRLALVEAAGGTPRVLTPEHPDSYVPQFTPDGSTIIFIRRDGGLYRIASDGTALRQIADGVQVEFFLSRQDAHGSTDMPALAPDGNHVAFIRAVNGAVPQVAVVDSHGDNLCTHTTLPGTCGRVHWSPDGQRLAFVSFVGDKPQLFVMPADRSGPPRQLTTGSGAVYALSWLPSAS